MGFTDYQDALRGDFDTQMASASPSTLIYWPNVKKPLKGGNTTPQTPPDLSKSTAPWCRHFVLTSVNTDISPGFRDDLGQVVVQCFGAPDKGPGPVEDLAETIAQQFRRRRVTISGSDVVNFSSVSVKEIGIEPEGWYQVNVTARFSRVEAA